MYAFYKKALLTVILAFALVTLTSSVFAQSMGAVKTVKLTPPTAESEVGQQMKFTASAFDADGKQLEIKAGLWIALPQDLAIADNAGTVTMYAPGEVRVIAMIAGKPAVAKVRVRPARVKQVDISRLEAPLLTGGTYKFRATAIGVNGDPQGFGRRASSRPVCRS